VRCISESTLKESLELNNSSSKEEIDQLLNKFWEIYDQQVKQNPEEFQRRSYQTNLISKKT
jgi:DNA polymerase sigma